MRTRVWLVVLLAMAVVFGGVVGASAKDFVVGIEAEPTSLDPFNTTDGVSLTVQQTMFEGLVTFGPDGRIIPMLAEEFYFNDDATQITFELRKGVKFHDGTELTSFVVKQNFDFVRRKENGMARSNFFSFIDEIVVDGKYNVTFKSNEPNSAMAAKFAHRSAKVKSAKQIQKKVDNSDYNLDRDPVGTGPFKFKEWESGQKVVVVPFEDYWDEERKAKVDRMVFKPVQEASTRINMLKTGEVHFVYPLPTMDADNLRNAQNIEVFTAPTVDVFYIGMNLQRDKYSKKVRHAMNHAINKDQLIAQVLDGYGRVADSPIAPSVYGYFPQAVYEYDKAKAQQLLMEAGYPDGLEATLWARNNTEFISVAEFVAIQLEEIGIDVEVQAYETGTLFDMLDNNKGTDLWVGRWGPGTGEADYGMRPNFASDRVPPNWNNSGFYINKEVDELLDKALSSPDQELRLTYYQKLQQIIYDDAPWIFLYVPDRVAAKRTEVKGVYIYRDGSIHINEAEFK